VRQKLFGNGDPIGASIRLKQIACRVIGILDVKGASELRHRSGRHHPDPDPDLPAADIAGNQDVSMIYASIRDGVSTEKGKGRHRSA
jgi:putative ABC transport system permease protein